MFAIGFLMTFCNFFNLAMSLNLPVLSNHNLLTDDLKNIIASLINIIFNCFVIFIYIIIATLVFTTKNETRTNPLLTEKANTTNGHAIIKSNITEPKINNNDNSCTFHSFASTFIVISLSATLILTLAYIVFEAYKRYRDNIELGSMAEPEP